ncbi:hypothetical protein [Mycolicibacterium mageritense]|uniref:Minor tail protein n=1 Tax=Mycolicibacterium mageritense TaxID=53462 RepID=A0AAI8XN85_MYCME|nr:hypothetical protein [Mycolicibacterium mageritense]BDY31419.1 hypothetical protein hbim_05371 [Mycolicibacterium mageritense]
MSWPTTPDGERYLFEGIIEIPVNAETGAAILMLRPQGGMGVGIPPVAQGPAGKHATISTDINFSALEPEDSTPDSASWTLITPPDDDTPGEWKLNLALHKGAKGDDGDTILDPGDFGTTPVSGQMLQVKSDLSAFELVAQRIPEVCYPGSVLNMPSGNANFTVAQIPIPSRPYARRVLAQGGTVLSGEAADVRYDLIARLGSETGGNIVGRCPGIAQVDRLTFWPGKDAGLADGYDQIAANAAGTLYIRCERQAGTSTATTSATTSRFSALVLPL